MTAHAKLLQTAARLLALSQADGATPAERAAAHKAYRRVVDAYTLDESQIHGATQPPAWTKLSFTTAADRALLLHIAWCLGLTAFTVRNPNGGRLLKRLHFEGDPLVVPLLEDLYRVHRKRFNNRVDAYAEGLAAAMFPSQPPKRDPSAPPPPPLSDEERDSYFAGLEGSDRVPVRALEASS